MDAPLEPARAAGRRSRILVYDGECPLCTRLTGALVRLRVIGPEERRPYEAFEGEEARRLEEARIGDQILVLDTRTGELCGGAGGLLWKLAETPLAPLARLVDRPWARGALEVLYRFVALNRRFLSTPKPRAVDCACDPEERPAYVLAFL